MRAVHHGLEGAPAQQSALLTRLAYWPEQQELDARSAAFADDVLATYSGLAPAAPAHAPAAAPAAPLPPQQLLQPAGMPGPGAAGAGLDASDPMAAAFLAMQPGADPQQQQQQQQQLAAALAASGSGAPPPMAPPRPAVELPPEGFSQAGAAAGTAAGAGPGPGPAGGGLREYGDLIEEDDDALSRPFVLTKTVKVQGRVAVAVPAGDAAALAASSSGSLPTAAAGLGVGSGRGGAAAAASTAAAGAAAALSSLPVGDPLSRTSSGSGSVGFGGGGGGVRPGSAGKAVFVLNGKLYDARGNEVDPAAAAGPGGGVTVVDCGEVTTPRMSSSNSASNASSAAAAAAGAGTPTRLAAPPMAPLAVGSPGPGSTAAGGRGVGALAPLKHGGIPVTAALRPGSATGAAAFMGGSPGPLRQPPAAAAAAASAAAPRADDPLRAAALAAAMRELGITDLPAPSSSGRPAATGAAPSPQPHPAAAHTHAGGEPDWPRLQARGAQPPLPANGHMPSYVQYGLPPNYRPSSGRRPGSAKPPPARSAPAAAAPAAGAGDEGDALLDYDMDDQDRGRYDDGDFEARLQQQVESNVLKTGGPVAAPPVARAAAPGAGKAAPGAYLPPRAGAATSGGLGASPAAATAAAVAAGSRLGKATAAMASAGGGGGGAAARKGAAVASDLDYPEESEFELQLQRQIDDANAFSGGGGGLGAVRAAKGAGSGGGGGAGWRGHSGSGSTAGMGAAAAATVAAAPGLKRSNSAASASGAGGGAPSSSAAAAASAAQGAGPRRVSADSSPAGKAGVPVAARVSAGSAPRQHPVAATASGSPARPPPAPAAAAAGARASPARAAAAASGANASPAKAPDVHRLKANWDALGLNDPESLALLDQLSLLYVTCGELDVQVRIVYALHNMLPMSLAASKWAAANNNRLLNESKAAVALAKLNSTSTTSSADGISSDTSSSSRTTKTGVVVKPALPYNIVLEPVVQDQLPSNQTEVNWFSIMPARADGSLGRVMAYDDFQSYYIGLWDWTRGNGTVIYDYEARPVGQLPAGIDPLPFEREPLTWMVALYRKDWLAAARALAAAAAVAPGSGGSGGAQQQAQQPGTAGAGAAAGGTNGSDTAAAAAAGGGSPEAMTAAAPSLAEPRTWDELLALAAAVEGRDMDGDGHPDHGLCLDLARGCKLWSVLSAVYASMAQTEGRAQGVWFDVGSMAPLLDNPAMAAALALVRRLAAQSWPPAD
ncbi:hypothetical protein HXX76_011481 [Chlamydomonas incerta]|uniref:Uncharacterized protein n=1 Tax=Chlamydomonas incerta TaxID=51695 RepID=A0A835SZJ4_CHLIN|nr:hypothetical protein HXX76_011481 [Chlamydomonas incerta]|eukprot:KAG2428781.1 hypothetical protein HXX76_011481 [Chlamydomonas incerta]